MKMHNGYWALLVAVAATLAGCATYDPRPRVIYPPPKPAAVERPAAIGGIPAPIAETIRGRKIYVYNLPQEVRGLAVDFVRAAGGAVVDYNADYEFRVRYWTQELSYAGGFGRVTFSGRSELVFELALHDVRRDGLLLFRGRGETILYGGYDAGGVLRAGAASFINLH